MSNLKSPSKSIISSRGPETDKADFVSNPMLEAKCNRKRAEVDLQLLANRIALLKAEEAKALQKISVTKERAEEIINIKKRNELSGTDRASLKMLREEQLRNARIRAQSANAARKARREETQRLVNETKSSEAAQKKIELERNLEVRRKQLMVEEVEKRQRVEEQRKRHELVKLKSVKEKALKEQKAQAIYSAKLTEELRRTEEADALIAQLEQEEKAMMDRLRVVHDSQQSAYKVLKSSLDC
jgi:hypothetical protein